MTWLTPEMSDCLALFRERALTGGAPADEIDRWVGLARPAVLLAPTGDGSQAAWFGDVRVPAPHAESATGMVREHPRRDDHHLMATVDLSAVPRGATDLPLPTDGHLLFYASPEMGDEDSFGAVDYLPAGTRLGERTRDYAEYTNHEILNPNGCGTHEELEAGLRQIAPLHPHAVVTLPDHEPTYYCAEVPDPLAAQFTATARLRDAWHDTRWSNGLPGPHLQLGGWASALGGEFGDPVRFGSVMAVRHTDREPDPDGWTLLAQMRGVLSFASLFWVIRTADLETLRFGKVQVVLHWRP
jgi:hypothetical protein